MTEETKITRRPGRPRKTAEKTSSSASVETAPAVQPEAGNELEAMQNQIRYQMAQLKKMADATGVDLSDMFPTPPKETTVVLEPEQEVHPQARASRPDVVTATGQPVGKLAPGTVLPGGNWVPWSKADLNPEDTTTFVPQPVPSLVFPMTDENGQYKIKLDVNDLICWLTCGVNNTVNTFFYNAYMDGYNGWLELEQFKRTGPASAPWGARGPDGRPSWHYEPAAYSFGMDIDGHYLRPGQSTIDEVRAEEPDAI